MGTHLSAYTTLRDTRFERRVADEAARSGDDFIKHMLPMISARIDRLCGADFMPTIATRYFDAQGDDVQQNGTELVLRRSLLASTSVTDGLGRSLVEGTDYVLWPNSGPPYTRLVALPDQTQLWSEYSTNPQRAITVTGVWGFHDAYDNAWLDSGDTVVDAPLTSAAKTITVNDVEDTDAMFRSPRFSPGHVLKIEDEFLYVADVDHTQNKLGVIRGIQGSTAAEHAAATQIFIYEPVSAVHLAATLWLDYMYTRRGTYEQVTYDGVAAVAMPGDAPEIVKGVLRDAGLLAGARRPAF